MAVKYCMRCAGELELQVPEGDDRPRHVCRRCGWIHYVNPKVVVGCIAEWEGRILLCQRSIEPRSGKWTFPAGFLESGETVAAGTERELYEEALARVEHLTPYALYNLAFVDQFYFIFRAQLIDGAYGIGSESMDAGLFEEQEIPWDDLAFTVIRESLTAYFQDRRDGRFQFHMGDISPEPHF